MSRRIWRRLLWLVLGVIATPVVIVVAGLLFLYVRRAIDGPVEEWESKIAIPHAPWVVGETCVGCYFGGGTQRIVAENTETGRRIVLLDFDDMEDMDVVVDCSTRVTIFTDAAAKATTRRENFDGIRVALRPFTRPSPAENEAWEKYWEHPEGEEGRRRWRAYANFSTKRVTPHWSTQPKDKCDE